VEGFFVDGVCDAGSDEAAGEDGPAVEVPLDGTIYDLETGKVWHSTMDE
jgi:predicted heme/steroid binding protein